MQGLQEYLKKVKNKIIDVYEKTLVSFIRSLFASPVSILFLGIDNAGKTTLINKLKNDTNETLLPTHHPSKTQIEIGNLKASAVDLGGHTAARLAWKDYFYNCDGIIFIVDVSDTERFDEVREAWNTVRSMERSAPIQVLMSKIDLVNHTPESAEADYPWLEDIKQRTGIYEEPISTGQPVKISCVSIIAGSAGNLSGPLARAFKWLEMMISMQSKK